MTVEEAEHMLATRLYQNTAKVHFNALERGQGPVRPAARLWRPCDHPGAGAVASTASPTPSTSRRSMAGGTWRRCSPAGRCSPGRKSWRRRRSRARQRCRGAQDHDPGQPRSPLRAIFRAIRRRAISRESFSSSIIGRCCRDAWPHSRFVAWAVGNCFAALQRLRGTATGHGAFAALMPLRQLVTS